MRLGQPVLMHRLWLTLCLGLSLWLAGCGGGAGTKYNEFMPQRIVLIGDEITYVGCSVTTQNGQSVCAGTDDLRDRFNVNPASASSAFFVNNWVYHLALRYGLSVGNIIESTSGCASTDTACRRTARLGSKAAQVAIQGQSPNIPSYAAGDMLVIAGGTHDVLAILKDTSIASNATLSLKRGYTADIVNRIKSQYANDLSLGKAYHIIKAAQDYQDIALDMINNRGQRNVFLTPIYDFSNSPHRSAFCNTGDCSEALVKQAVNLFNFALKTLTKDNFETVDFYPGQPRILLTTGITSTDLLYQNITQLTGLFGSAVNNFNLAASICGVGGSTSGSTVLTTCTWNGLFTTSNGTAPSANVAVTDFISGLGAYMYASDFYLGPRVQETLGGTFYTFMRGFNGW